MAEALTQHKMRPGNWRWLNPESPSVRSAPYYSRPRETAKSTPPDPGRCTTPLGGPSKREMEAEWGEDDDCWLPTSLITDCTDAELEIREFGGELRSFWVEELAADLPR